MHHQITFINIYKSKKFRRIKNTNTLAAITTVKLTRSNQFTVNLGDCCHACMSRNLNFEFLRGSLPKSGPLDFATKNTFPLFFVGEEALVGTY